MYSIECVFLQPHPTFHHLSSLSQFPTFHPPPCASSLQLLLPGRHPLLSRAYIYIYNMSAIYIICRPLYLMIFETPINRAFQRGVEDASHKRVTKCFFDRVGIPE